MKQLLYFRNFKSIRILFSITGLIIILFIVLSGFRSDGRKKFKNYVLLVSLDGFRWDYPQLYNTPNINKIAIDG